MLEMEFKFDFRIIANDDFLNSVLEPILEISGNVADTSELFMRSYQMLTLFGINLQNEEKFEKSRLESATRNCQSSENYIDNKNNQDDYADRKVGWVANNIMRKILESGKVDPSEVSRLQDKKYSKDNLGLNLPVLVMANAEYDKARYYVDPILINGIYYKLCREWYENRLNNDRPYLIEWVNKFK